MSEQMGFKTRCSFEATGDTFDSSSVRFPVVRDTIGMSQTILDSGGAMGSRSLYDYFSRTGQEGVGGQIEFEPSLRLIDFFLSYILGGTESSDSWTVADDLPAFDRMKDAGGDVVQHNGLMVSKADLTFAPGLLKLTLDCVGLTETYPASFLSASFGSTALEYYPLAFQDCAFTLQAGTRRLRSGTLSIDNMLEPIFSSGSVQAEEIISKGRVVTLTSTTASSSTEWTDLYHAANTPATGTILITAGSGLTSTITLRKLKAPKRTPAMEGKDAQVPLTLVWQARHDGTNPEITWVNDPVT